MLLDKNVMPDDPKSAKAIVSKMALDQLIWAPMFSCVFFTFIRTLEVCFLWPKPITLTGVFWLVLLHLLNVQPKCTTMLSLAAIGYVDHTFSAFSIHAPISTAS